MPQPARRRVFKLEVNVFDLQINRDERFAPRLFAPHGGIIADAENKIASRRTLLGRLLANTLDEIKLAWHERRYRFLVCFFDSRGPRRELSGNLRNN